jgi:O-antigen ligase
MSDRMTRLLVAAGIISAAVFAVYVAVMRPFYFSNIKLLGTIVFLQLLVASIWEFRRRFFPFLMFSFICAGTLFPMQDDFTVARWLVLAVGAGVGFIIYLKDRRHYFTSFHLAAFFCVLGAIVSAMVSAYPKVALLKVASFLLLFLYGASGARLAVAGREDRFFRGLLLGCEILVYFSAISYFIAHWEFWGNRNSLGLVMSVVVLPFLLWGLIISPAGWLRRRRTFATVLALLLLLSSYERAGFAAAFACALFICLPLRRYKLLVVGGCAALLLAVVVSVTVPLENAAAVDDHSFEARFLFKGKTQIGILGSRRPAWQDTLATLQEHPWFGSGFGTTDLGYDGTNLAHTYSDVLITREHGNSYLEIIEWVGILGVAPFLLVTIFLLVNVARVGQWMFRSCSPYSPAVPIAAVLIAGLVNAGFEDWLFAVGYHACVFFWAMAFVLPDLLPKPVPVFSPAVRPSWNPSFAIPAAHGISSPAR